MPTCSPDAFCCFLSRRASIPSATTVSSPMAPAVIASLSVVGCSKPVPRVPSTSLPTITPKAIARSPLLTSPSVLIAVAPCGGSQSCHAPATLSHSPATRHDVPTYAHGDRARSQSCGQRCQHRHRAADQSFQSAMPTVPAPEIDATTAHQPRSPVPRANKPISARTLQPRLNVKPQQAFATIPIAPHLRGFVQSGFYEVALTTHAPGPFSHATSQNPQDSKAHAHRFDCFKFQFHSNCSETFATQSPRKRTNSGQSRPCLLSANGVITQCSRTVFIRSPRRRARVGQAKSGSSVHTVAQGALEAA